MNFHPQEVPLSRGQAVGATTIEIEDLNILIDSLKRREENIIQLLDYNLKFKSPNSHMDVVHLRGLYLQLNEREKKRVDQEESITQKYIEYQINDEYQKKLLNKMKNKISQLNSSAKEKLVQLGIYPHAKQVYMGIAAFEETLSLVLSQFPIDVHFFLNCLIQSSRKRFSDEIDKEVITMELPKPQKGLDSGQNTLRQEISTPKTNIQKITPPTSNKPEEGKVRENFRVRNLDPNSVSVKDLSKIGRSSLTVKSVDSRPSFDFREDIKAAYDMLGVQRASYTNNVSEAGTILETNSNNETINEQATTPPTEAPSYRESILKSDPDPLAMSINLNQSTVNAERASANIPNVSNRMLANKKVKISTNKRSICIDETSEPQVEKKEQEKPKINKDAWLKSYDILKIEYQPLPTATKKETKKLLMEKVYKELWSTNTDIKRTIKKYRNKYLLSIGKKPLEDEDKLNESMCDSETNRAKSLTPKTHSGTAPVKPKPSAFNPNQKSIFYVENPRDIENTEMNGDNFMTSINSYTPNGTVNFAKQNRESKKPSSTKFLVLPKLNLYSEGQNQPTFQCWPIPSQNAKPLKPNFMIDLGNKAKFEKIQKGTDRPLNNLLIETKADGAQDILNMSLGNQNNAARTLSSYSNKNLYPLTLNPLESASSLNKQIPL